MLHLEIKNSKSKGLLLMMRVFDRFRAPNARNNDCV